MTFNRRWVLFGALWIFFWSLPLLMRPVIKTFGVPQAAVVRGSKAQLMGTRCIVFAGTTIPGKKGPRKVRFYAYTGPQGCQAYKPGKPATLLLLKAGPVYWVQLTEDYGHWRGMWFWDLSLALPATAILLFVLYKLKNRPPPGSFLDRIKAL